MAKPSAKLPEWAFQDGISAPRCNQKRVPFHAGFCIAEINRTSFAVQRPMLNAAAGLAKQRSQGKEDGERESDTIGRTRTCDGLYISWTGQ
jgi:hypothetical protein